MIYGIISVAALLVGLLFGYIISKNSIQKKLTKYLQLLIQCDIIFKYVKIQNLIEWENEKFQDVQMTTSRKIYRRFYRG